MKLISAFLLLLISFTSNGQSNSYSNVDYQLDSLKRIVNTAKDDSSKLNALELLTHELLDYNLDSSLKYADRFINLANKLNKLRYVAIAYQYKAHGYWYQSNYAQAEEYYLKSLSTYEELQDKNGVFRNYVYLGEIYHNEGNFLKAFECGQKSVRIAEELGDKRKLADSYYLIGIVHRKQNNLDKAIEYYQKSLKISEEFGDKSEMSHCYNSIGVAYRSLGNYPKALEYYEKSIKIKEEQGNKNGIAIGYNNIGNVHSINKNYSEALEFYKKALKIMESIENKQGVSMVLGNMASLYDTLGRYNEAIDVALTSLNIAKKIGSIEDERFAQENLYFAYKGLKDYRKALKHFELFKILNDSIYNAEKYNQLVKMEAIYQSDKKQKEIELLKTLSAAESRKQKVITYSVGSILFLVLIFSLILYRSYLQKQKANILLAQQKALIEEKNEELNQQNEEIAAQRDDLFRQKSIALQQRDEITRQKKSITDSIAYAEHIQTAMLPNENEVIEVIPNSFVFFKPLDIVSGDFYWVNKNKGNSIIAVADCTGHGVPGAFMSIMGINFLNTLIVEQEVFDPGEVLNQLNHQVIAALSHTDSNLQDKDGMDISVCLIDNESLLMKYSSAKIKVLICRNGKVIQLETDKYSIGKSPLFEKISFLTRSYQLNKSDMIYLMTDGYTDQFGGKERTKFLSSRFKKMVLEIANLSIPDQKRIIKDRIEEWQGSFPQVDDMLIVGIRV